MSYAGHLETQDSEDHFLGFLHLFCKILTKLSDQACRLVVASFKVNLSTVSLSVTWIKHPLHTSAKKNNRMVLVGRDL